MTCQTKKKNAHFPFNFLQGVRIMGVKVREKEQGSGVWWIIIHHAGQKKTKRIGPKKLALQVAEILRAQLVLGGLPQEGSKPVPTFREYSRLWLSGYVAACCRRSTFDRYQIVLKRHINPVFGRTAIDKIKRGDVRDFFVSSLNSGVQPSTVRLYRDILSGVMGYAVDAEIIQANPVQGITKRLRLTRKRATEVKPYSSEEMEIILEVCRRDYPEFYPIMLTGFRTGMRLGEILGLKWGDIDFRSSIIEVRRSYRNRQVSKTKTGNIRQVDMSADLGTVLKNLQTERKKEALRSGTGQIVEWVYHRRTRPIAQNTVRNNWRSLLRTAGVRYEKIHIARHTFASILLQAGVSPVYVQRQLGHANISMTVDQYGHFMPTERPQATPAGGIEVRQ